MRKSCALTSANDVGTVGVIRSVSHSSGPVRNCHGVPTRDPAVCKPSRAGSEEHGAGGAMRRGSGAVARE